MQGNLWGQVKAAAESGVLMGGYPFARNHYYVGSAAPLTVVNRPDTIQDAINLMIAKDILHLGPGSYDEAVVIPAGLADITIIGEGNRGDIGIAPSATDATALKMTGTSGSSGRVQGVTLINVGCEGNGTGGGLHVKGNIRRLRVIGCKCEGGAFGIKLESDANGSVADTILDDIELAWTTIALHLAVSGGGDPVTQTRLINSLLHNYVTGGVSALNTFAKDLWIQNNMFANQEDATKPTTYINAAIASTTGFVSGNHFANTTNQAAVLAIAAGVIWGPNGTEAGWSTARPS